MFRYEMAWIMYDKDENVTLAIDYFQLFDFVNDMINDGHSITLKP